MLGGFWNAWLITLTLNLTTASDPQCLSIEVAEYLCFCFLCQVPPIDSSSTEGEVLDDSSFKGNISFSDIEFFYPSRRDIKVPYKLM